METKELEELLVCEEALIYFQSCTSYKEGWEKCPQVTQMKPLLRIYNQYFKTTIR